VEINPDISGLIAAQISIVKNAQMWGMGEYKTEKMLQIPEIQEFAATISGITERAGFEPAVQTSHTQPFQGCSLSHSDTSPTHALNCFNKFGRI
jgi:hypothetical protein